MKETIPNINVKNLCSRKLWELISSPSNGLPVPQKSACKQELIARNHYLPELKQLQHQHIIN